MRGYHRGAERGTARPEVLQSLLKTTDRVVQEIDSVEYGLTDIQVRPSFHLSLVDCSSLLTPSCVFVSPPLPYAILRVYFPPPPPHAILSVTPPPPYAILRVYSPPPNAILRVYSPPSSRHLEC